MKTIALDVLGSLPESIEGDKYLLIDMDNEENKNNTPSPPVRWDG